MPNQHPSVTLNLNIDKPYDKDLINNEFTKSLALILISTLPRDKDFINNLLSALKKNA